MARGWCRGWALASHSGRCRFAARLLILVLVRYRKHMTRLLLLVLLTASSAAKVAAVRGLTRSRGGRLILTKGFL